MPEPARPFVERMIDTNLLARYGEPAVRDRALRYILDRLRLADLGPALTVIVDTQLTAFVEDFHRYFPRLQAFAAEERRGSPDD